MKKWKMSWNTNKTTLKFNQIIIQYEIANQILATYLEAGQISKANKVFTRVLMTSSSRQIDIQHLIKKHFKSKETQKLMNFKLSKIQSHQQRKTHLDKRMQII